jgi:hypothetical protein
LRVQGRCGVGAPKDEDDKRGKYSRTYKSHENGLRQGGSCFDVGY